MSSFIFVISMFYTMLQQWNKLKVNKILWNTKNNKNNKNVGKRSASALRMASLELRVAHAKRVTENFTNF